MTRCYFENRLTPLDQTTFLAADIMRHLETRQYLGKTLILCDSPFATMRVARKQWLKLARTIQRQRSSTINADKILRFTYTITHMQHMQFSAKTPNQSPETHVFFISPEQAEHIPLNCFTVYIAAPISKNQLAQILTKLPETALVVDYTKSTELAKLSLLPKTKLEEDVDVRWRAITSFLQKLSINIHDLTADQFIKVDALDTALDTLLSTSHDFLRLASEFQHSYELAQPSNASKEQQLQYNTIRLLAYRVHALTPGVLSEYMLRTYHEDETYFLHDIAADLTPLGETAPETIARHQVAGRVHLAEALQNLLQTPRAERPQPHLPLRSVDL